MYLFSAGDYYARSLCRRALRVAIGQLFLARVGG